MRAEDAFWLRDALDSMYARAISLQIRACCSVELHDRAAQAHQLNASASQALACAHRCTLFGGV